MNKICIDCRYIGARPSGIGELVGALVDRVPALAPDLEFLLLRNPQRREKLSTSPNVLEVEVNAAANGPGTMWFLPQLVDLRDVAVFHAPSNILPAGLNRPTITTIHDIMWLTHPEWCNPSLYGHVERIFYQHGLKRALNRSSRIATVSHATKEEILKLRPDLEEKLVVTRSGVSDRFKPQKVGHQYPSKFGIARGKRFVLVVGQSSPYKNHTAAVTGFAQGLGDNHEVDLLLVQRRGNGGTQLMELAEELGIAGRVHLSGPVEEDELIKLYSSSAALLHPSLCEGFGNPIAEAMACGCPVITSNLSAMPEVTGSAARLVNPYRTSQIAQALREVVCDLGLAASMREAGLKRAKELSWDRFAEQHVEIYRELLAPA